MVDDRESRDIEKVAIDIEKVDIEMIKMERIKIMINIYLDKDISSPSDI